MNYVAAFLTVLACVSPTQLALQEAPALAPGARVRVWTMEIEKVVGVVQEVTSETLVLNVDDRDRQMFIPLASLTRIETSGGRVPRGQAAWKAAKWGALFGAVPGAISLGLQHEQVGENGSSVAKAMALGAFSGGLFGGIIGAAIGAIRPGEDWQEAVLPSVQLASTGKGSFREVSFAVSVVF